MAMWSHSMPVELEHLLNSDADGRAAAPDADQESRAKAAA